MNTYTIDTKQKFFILNGKKYYFSSLDQVSIFHKLERIEFSFYKENKKKNTFETVSIPSALAQDLINLCHVHVDLGGFSFVKREVI